MDSERPRENDLILRPLPPVAGVEHYIIVDAHTSWRVAGPFPTLGDAVLAARDLVLKRGVTAWLEHLDEQGHTIRSPTRLFSVQAT